MSALNLRRVRAASPAWAVSSGLFLWHAIVNWGFLVMAPPQLILAVFGLSEPKDAPVTWICMVSVTLLIGSLIAYHKLRMEVVSISPARALRFLREVRDDVQQLRKRAPEDPDTVWEACGQHFLDVLPFDVFPDADVRNRSKLAEKGVLKWQVDGMARPSDSFVVMISRVGQKVARDVASAFTLQDLLWGIDRFMEYLDARMSQLEYYLGIEPSLSDTTPDERPRENLGTVT